MAETTPGRRHEWCEGDIGPGWRHVGQEQAGCPFGQVKGVCEGR